MPKKGSISNYYVVQLFTDGACKNNPGPGGWAFILRDPATGRQIKRSGSEVRTTNNRMELMAVIRGLEALRRPCHVVLYTDSTYVGRGLTEWLPKWKARNWISSSTGLTRTIKNIDLWKRLDQLLKQHQLEYVPVRGHSGHPENEECDRMAVAAIRQVAGEDSRARRSSQDQPRRRS
ncbi:MAG: ribonuclease H [Pirellulaceae bacterium]|nr:MAG: ribonuclease H [Pirellulaceae bacterium]